MCVEKFIEDMRSKVCLETNDIKFVLIHKTDYVIEVMDKMKDETRKMVKLQRTYKEEKKLILKQFLEEGDDDIFAQLKSKEDREIIMYSTDKLNDLLDEIETKKRNIRQLEDLIKEIKNIPTVVKTIIEWERFDRGE